MLNQKVKCSFDEVPFRSTLSFELLIRQIEEIGKDKTNPFRDSALKVIKELSQVPGMKKPIADFKLVKENRALVDKMMAFAVSPHNGDVHMSAATAPFYPKSFYSTKLFDETLRGEHLRIEIANAMGENKKFLVLIYQAYLIILKKFYDFQFDIDLPFVSKLINEKDRSVSYFKMNVNPKYTEVKVKGKLRELSQKELKSLFDNTTDLDYWNELIPLNKFEFTGFLHFYYFNITHEFVISQLKSELLDKNAIISQSGFNRIREKVRTLMDNPELSFGLAAFSDFESTINQNVIWKSILPQSELACEEYLGTVYETAYLERRPVLTNDFKDLGESKATSLFLRKGIRSHAVVPLILEDEIVGMIEFGAKDPGGLNFVQIGRFHELFPVFALAMKRSKDEMNDRVQAIIQEECTAIHPTVAWRFWQAASAMLDAEIKGEAQKMESITFPDVVPIYGATDIRNSSLERNKAIQSDLMVHLKLAKTVLVEGMAEKDMPLLDHLIYKIDRYCQTVKSGLKAGDEVSILEFIRKEIEPVLKQLKNHEKKMANEVDRYFFRMDKNLGVLYEKRRDFEESLTHINDRVGEILDEEQVKAQGVFPHYFEKYRTDGVEYNAYIGQSMVKDVDYHEIYLRNIRLWQLLVKARIAREVRDLIPSLKTQLDVTQLILVHANPLSIAFRQDEKKFDVAGAYNIRYEITKKRIDKAVIKGSNERITQVGKIAIIYSHSEEIEEYNTYIEYMIAKGYLKDRVENLELEDMKGASGLRALRVEINFDTDPEIDDINIAEIKKVIESN